VSTIDPDVPPRLEGAPTRSWLVPILKAGVSLALLGVLLSRVDVGRLWTVARTASTGWLGAALGLYLVMILLSAWRWGLLLNAQGVRLPFRKLTSSFLVATFFNNFLPSNIGGDVIRVSDTAPAAGSRTLATTVVLIDRGIGLLGLVLIAAMGASAGPRLGSEAGINAGILWAGFGVAAMMATPALLAPDKFMRLLKPLRVINPTWVDVRLGRMTEALARFRDSREALGGCFAGAVGVQAVLVAFYFAVAHSMRIPIGFAALAVIVPITFVVQMLPVSMNGFGVREATFGFYFTRLGLPLESALLMSFMGAALILLFSLSGGVVYVARLRAARPA
jgi:glycosyltransferase 2 family protein